MTTFKRADPESRSLQVGTGNALNPKPCDIYPSPGPSPAEDPERGARPYTHCVRNHPVHRCRSSSNRWILARLSSDAAARRRRGSA